MGCGNAEGSSPRSRKDRVAPVAGEGGKRKEEKGGQSTSSAVAHSTTAKDMEGLQITQSQFVIENTDNIYNNYSFREKVGEGSFGVVYRAVHRSSKEVRAIKMIEKASSSAQSHAKLMHEISILKELDHPHIVKLFEFYTDSKYFYLVTEFVDGGELFDVIHKKKMLSEESAANVIQQLLSAIIYCHERKIVHRDLKPENVLIETASDGKMNIKVIDFGTANAFSSNSKMRQTMGTPYYIAPEVLLKSYDEKCDVWSCGVILYILLCGLPPFNGRTDEDIMNAVRRAKFHYHHEIWKEISSEAKDLINNMLKCPPEQRFSAQQAYKHEWIARKSFNKLKASTAEEILNNLKNFNSEHKLQQAALMYIATQLVSKKEKQNLEETFMALDKNADGKLSREELIEGYKVIHGDIERAVKEVDTIMGKVDVDHNGFIDYSEFLIASIDKKKLMSKDNLKKAFMLFDRDGSGLISADEVKTILGIGKRFSEHVWELVIGEVDQNSDGEISFEEFEKMMQKFLE